VIPCVQLVLGESPIAFNRVGVVPCTRDKRSVMVDQLMRIAAFIKAAVALPTVSVYRAAPLYMLLHKGLEHGALDVRDGYRSNGSIALNESDYGSFASGTAPSLTFAATAKIRFIDLNMARQLVGKRITFNGRSDLREHLPGGLVGHPDLILQLIGRNSDLEQRDRTYPFRDRCSRLFKDGSRRLGKLILTAPALVFKAVLPTEPPDCVVSTSRTSYPSRPANLGKKLATLALISKIKTIIVQSHEDLLHLDFAYPSIQLVPQRG